MLVTTAIEHFCTAKLSEGLRTHSVTWYRDTLALFDRWLAEPSRHVETITTLEIRQWLVHERLRGLSTHTIEGRFRALLAFFNWCESEHVVPVAQSPLGHGLHKQVARPRVDTPSLDYVRYEEYQAVIAAIDLATWIDYRDWTLCNLLFWCGLRRGELLALQVGDIDFKSGNLILRTTKSRQARLAPFPDFIGDGLVAYITLKAPAVPLWPSANLPDQPLTTSGLRQMLERRCKRAGIRYLHPHLWRHGFAMTMLNDGSAQFSTVSALLGHSSVKVTEKHYARWLTGPLRREYLSAIHTITG